MEILSKIYKKENNKKYIKTNNLFFIFNGVNCHSIDKVIIDQYIKNTSLRYQKIVNKTVNLAIKKSVYCNLSSVIAGVLFFIKPNTNLQTLYKKTLHSKLETFAFFLSAAKLNNKIYPVKLIKNLNFLDYSDNNLLLLNSASANLKFHSNKLKKSK